MGSIQSVQDLPAHGGLCSFNMDHGYIEAVCRGYRKGFLTDAEYRHLRNATSLSDVRLNLQETDYGNFLLNEPVLDASLIRKRATEKWVSEFKYMRSQAVEPLATFLDYICYQYMIDNVFKILNLFKNSDVGADVNQVIETCHPLGMFDDAIMKSIASFEPTKDGTEMLVWTVLIGTPVGKYFEDYLLSLKNKQKLQGSDEVKALMSEQHDFMLRNGVTKLYLEDFYAFTQRLGGETAEIMGHILKVRADQIVISIVDNSFIEGFEKLSSTKLGRTERQSLLPTCGYLFPEAFESLGEVQSLADLKENVLKPYNDYRKLVERWAIDDDAEGKGGAENEGLDDGFYHYNVQLHENAFYGQSHFAIFYAFVKLKEQEVRNLMWICGCISMKDARYLEKLDRYIPLFVKRKLQSWTQRG